MARPSLKNDMRRAAEVHERWSVQRNRKQEAPGYREEWWAEQCGHCAHWVPLSGALGRDYGACGNPSSPFDGRVRFEHDGCDVFEPVVGDWVQPDIE